ncbi:MAG: SMC-Scp complex subunit ScpB [Nanoarchaeota archaeon]
MENKELKHRIEAVLFTLGKFLSLEDIGKYCETGSLGIIKEALEELRKDYTNRNCALEIEEVDGKFKLNIKKEFSYLTNKLLASKEMDSPTTKTLAIIAYKQPVTQSEVIKIRGNKAYDHIKALREQNLVSAERKGRTRLLKVTNNFYEYFDIAETEAKDRIKLAVEEQGIKKMF